MTWTTVLAQVDSQADPVATWLGAISGLFAAIGTITVAVIVYRWDRRRYMAERREREAEQRAKAAEQARLVTIEVNYETPGPHGGTFPAVAITNGSKNPVHRPQVESMGQAHVRSAHQGLIDEEGEEYCLQPRVLLQPHKVECVPFEYVDAAGRSISSDDAFFDETFKDVRADDVTITFVDMSNVQWRRTGNGEPIRVRPAPATE
jgi:hypothetical protein